MKVGPHFAKVIIIHQGHSFLRHSETRAVACAKLVLEKTSNYSCELLPVQKVIFVCIKLCKIKFMNFMHTTLI